MSDNKNSKFNVPDNSNQMPVPEAYANAAKISYNPYEVEMTMGIGSSNYEGVRPVVNIRMSPQFAKEFSISLMNHIKLYEETYGTIALKKPN